MMAGTDEVDFDVRFERTMVAWKASYTGQRNQVRIRVSNAAYDAGLRLKDFAVLRHDHGQFDAVVDDRHRRRRGS